MPSNGDLDVYNGSTGVFQNFTPGSFTFQDDLTVQDDLSVQSDLVVQGKFSLGFTPIGSHRFDVSDTVSGRTVESYFTATTAQSSGAMGWVLNKPKDILVPHTIDWRVGGQPTWGMGQDFDTDNSGNEDRGNTGNSDFVILYDYTAPKNETQVVSTGGAMGGSFILKFEDPVGNVQPTGNINWDATASQVQTELGNLSNVGTNNVSVTSPNANGGPWTVVFVGTLANKNYPQMTFTSSLTGGNLTVTELINGGPGADILRVSPGEESKSNNDYPGYGPKFLMSHIAGTPRKFGGFFTCEAGRGLAGISVSCFHPADTSPSPTDTSPVRSHIDLVQRNIGQLPGVAANQRCVIGFSGNTLNTGALWLVGTDVGSNNNQHFFVYDNKNSKHRLFLKSTSNDQGGIAVNHFSPTAAFHLGPGYAGTGGAPLKFTSGTNLTTTETGAVEYDGARLAFTPGASTRRSVALSSDHKTATTTVAYNSGEVSVFTGTIAAGEMAVGKTFIARVLGRYTTVNGADTFTIRCYIGGVLLTGFTFASAAGQISEAPIDVELIFTCRTTGSSGTVRAHAAVMLNHVDLSKGATGDTTLNTGAAQNVEIKVEWGAGSQSGDLVSIAQGFLQVLN